MEPVTNFLAAAILMINSASQDFSAGYQAWTNGNHAVAEAHWAQVVVSNELAEAKLGQLVQYWRGQLLEKEGQPSIAASEYQALLESMPPKPLFVAAAAAYEKTTGKPWKHTHADSPAACWAHLVEAIRENDRARVLALCTGNLQNEVVECLDSDESRQDLLKEIGDYAPDKTLYDRTGRLALLVLKSAVHSRVEKLIFRREQGWQLADEYNAHYDEHFSDALANMALPDWSEDRDKLDWLGVFLLDLLGSGKAMPTTREQLQALIQAAGDSAEKAAARLLSDMVKKPFVVVAPPAAHEAPAPWVFIPAATNSVRWGLIDGETRAMKEDAFQKLAFEKHVVVPLMDVAQMSDADRDRAKALIDELGAASHPRRQEAYHALKRLGEPVLPLLNEAQRSSDPEVVFQVRALLEELGR